MYILLSEVSPTAVCLMPLLVVCARIGCCLPPHSLPLPLVSHPPGYRETNQVAARSPMAQRSLSTAPSERCESGWWGDRPKKALLFDFSCFSAAHAANKEIHDIHVLCQVQGMQHVCTQTFRIQPSSFFHQYLENS